MQVQSNLRLYSIDIFRCCCAFAVFLFHARIHLNVNFGILNNFIGNSHIFMTAFFMLSGFALYYTRNLTGGGSVVLS